MLSRNLMIQGTGCPICNSTEGVNVLYYEAFPYFSVPVSKLNKAEILNRYESRQLSAPLDVSACVKCGHCYLATLPNEEVLNHLYSRYYSYPSPLKGIFPPERDKRFLEFFEREAEKTCTDRKLATILEVGCYDGYILYHIQKRGFDVTGCDPSQGAEIGKSFGVNILRQFFDANEFIKRKLTFDVVISRHFIEHVRNPREWVDQLKKVLNPGGLLILETPNVSFDLENGFLEVFSLQHLQGFCEASLVHLLKDQDMSILSMEATPNNLIAIAENGGSRKGNKDENTADVVKEFQQKFKRNQEIISETLALFKHGGKGIALWGAGGFGLAALTMYKIPPSLIKYIIDSDPYKWGMEYLNYDTPIVSPEAAGEMDPALIVVTSMYSKSIVKKIREMNFKSAVLTIFPRISLSQ